jgi:hypothetical protein
MKPRLFRLDDLINIPVIGFLIAGIIIGALVWNMVSPNGEVIPWQGWFVSLLTAASAMSIVVVFYVKRWQWISLYKYTSSWGVNYYYEPNTKPYLSMVVEEDTKVMVKKWSDYYPNKTFPKYKGTIVLFKSADQWKTTDPGWWGRQVCGLAYYNYAEVGMGNKPIEQTAHKHELSHLYINQYMPDYYSEDGAHELMAKVGV